MAADSGQPMAFEAFCQQVLQLLDEGRFVATYKFAVLIGLLDVLSEHVGEDGAPPQTISTRDLAAKVTELYWPHSRPFTYVAVAKTKTGGPSGRGPAAYETVSKVLLQKSGGQASIVRRITDFREQTVGDATLPLSRARQQEPAAYRALVRDVEAKLVEMPLGRLQVIGGAYTPFLYELDWDRERPPGASAVKQDAFDGRLRLVPGAADHLLRASPLIRPLVQRTWALTISRLGRLPDTHLERFLFGSDRVDLSPLLPGLRALHEDHCFYCATTTKAWHIDHFVPWARRIDDGLANLVLACASCNGSKREYLPSADHVERWVDRLAEPATAGQLADLATEKRWPYTPEATVAAARSIYLPLPMTYRLWTRAKTPLVPLEGARIRAALAHHVALE